MQGSNLEKFSTKYKEAKGVERTADSRFLVEGKYVLFLFVFTILLAGTTLGSDSFENSRIIFYYELLFITCYIFLLRPDPQPLRWMRHHKTLVLLGCLLFITIILFHFYLSLMALLYLSLALYTGIFHRSYVAKLVRKNKLPIIVLLTWLLEITFSYYLSPYQVSSHPLGRERYEQTLVHSALFLIAWDFFRENDGSIQPALITIALSSFAVAMGSLFVYLTADQQTLDPRTWFNDPPFHAHMRHVGYQITAGLAIILPLLAFKRKMQITEWSLTLLAIILWAFLFWSGGRSAIASVVITMSLLLIYLFQRRFQYKRYLFITFATAVAGLIISELLDVFPWNGLTQSIERVAGAKDMQKLTSGRIQIWLDSWAAVKDHLLLGLGPQGFFFITDKFRGIIQPHSMFIQFVVEWGFAGTVIFLVMIIWGFFVGLKNSMQLFDQNALIASLSAGSAITALTLHGLFDGTYYHPQPSLYLAIGFAAWLRPLHT